MVRQVSVQFTQYLYFLDNVNSHCVEVGLVYSADVRNTCPTGQNIQQAHRNKFETEGHKGVSSAGDVLKCNRPGAYSCLGLHEYCILPRKLSLF